MEEELGYDELYAKYAELQLRVTRFSSTEQELINTQDRLDQELLLYKKLSDFNTEALKTSSKVEFLQKVVETIIDIFETEVGIIHYTSKSGLFEDKLFIEGARKAEHKNLLNDLCALPSVENESQEVKIYSFTSENIIESSLIDSCLVSSKIEINEDVQIILSALITKSKAPIYNQLYDRHKTIFSVFTQQVIALLSNILTLKENKEQMIKIAQSEIELKKLSFIATKAKSGVIISDALGRIEWVNDSFQTTTGYSLEEVKGKKPKDFLQYEPITNKDAREKLSYSLGRKENVEVTILNVAKNGKAYYNHLEVTPIFDENGIHTNFIALQKDITAEETYKNELLKINSRFELITANSQIGIWEWNPATGESIYNDILIKLLQLTKEELSNAYEIFKSAIHPLDIDRAIRESDIVVNGEQDVIIHEYRLILPKTKELRYIEAMVVSERDQLGKVVRIMGSVKDVTQGRLYEEELIEKNTELQKINGELDQFVYSVSHDLRSPLLSIKGLLSLLDISLENEVLVKQYLGLIGTSVNRLDETIIEILDYSKNSRTDLVLDELDLYDLISEIYEDLFHVSEIQIDFKIDFIGAHTVFLDKFRISTVLKNFISNAIKYRNRNLTNPLVHVSVINSDKGIEINIVDNGEGISEENQKKVFDMFFRASSSSFGTGIGLYICQEITAKMGGEIKLSSKVGIGTTIRLFLPKLN
jgi:PAS domain S-box-containing protein